MFNCLSYMMLAINLIVEATTLVPRKVENSTSTIRAFPLLLKMDSASILVRSNTYNCSASHWLKDLTVLLSS